MSERRPSKAGERGLRTYSWALALVGVMCIVFPVADLVLTNIPWDLGRLTWRYQFIGRTSQMLITPVIGVTLLLAAATLAKSRWLALATLTVSLGATALLVVFTAVFLFEGTEARGQVPAEGAFLFEIGSYRAVAKLLLTALVLGVLGWSGWALRKGMKTTAPSSDAPGRDTLYGA